LIKKLDILILRSFIGPFIVTFFVTLFVLVMQFFWLYMDELIGKGLGSWMIVQLLFYMSTTMVPLALPLGILLASIMTFGNMGENFELVAIKSAGISLLRFIQPLFIFIVFIGALGFLFNNNVIPFANLKALSLLYDLRSKPSLNIRAGQFNKDIKDYSIRVGEKDNDGKTIRNIIIYDHSSGYGNDKVVLAKQGEMFPTPDKQFLIFRLKDGWRYEEEGNNYNGSNPTNKQIRMYFKKWDKVFDLSAFKLSRTNEDLFKDAYQMMDVNQLTERIDSMKRHRTRLFNNANVYLGPYVTLLAKVNNEDRKKLEPKIPKQGVHSYDSSFMQLVADTLRLKVAQLASSQVRNGESLLGITALDYKIHTENFVKFNVEWHRKFTLSFACILLFLIGAPLGAIIRKGGLGMPLVIAVLFFVVFHIMSITGEKLAKTGAMPAGIGMWMATLMLLPIAFILIRQARNDSQVLNKEWYTRLWQRLARAWTKNKTVS
jgi:lipopolysaccharide export system permease protein